MRRAREAPRNPKRAAKTARCGLPLAVTLVLPLAFAPAALADGNRSPQSSDQTATRILERDAEPTKELALDYQVYIGGFEVLKLDVRMDLADDRYGMDFTFRTFGFISRLASWSMQAYSEGALSDSAVTPRRAGQENSWQGKKRFVRMEFRDGTPVVTGAKPEPSEDDRTTVDPADMVGTVDLASAILMLMRPVRETGRCEGRIPVFDGRRRYDFVAEHTGEDRIRRSGYSAFAGTAVSCEVTMDRIAGFKRDQSLAGIGSEDDDASTGERRSAAVWLGEVFQAVPHVPVRLEIDSRWGNARAHLAGARLVQAGKTVAELKGN